MVEDEKKLSAGVSQTLERIKGKEHTDKQLINYIKNFRKHSDLTDWEKETLIEEVETQLRMKFPKAATRVLGGKSSKAEELLEEIFSTLENEFDWSQNQVKSKVKVGGAMISGRDHVCWYISYKNIEGYSSALIYRQKTIKDAPLLEVEYGRVGKQYENEKEVKEFPVDFREDAVDLYRQHLLKTII